jgi:hypothetical protein
MEEIKEEDKERELTDEEIDLIFTGKRPEGMLYDEYKAIRIELKKRTKQYLRGRMIHVSSWMEEVPKKDTEEKPTEYVRKTATYIKPKEDAA